MLYRIVGVLALSLGEFVQSHPTIALEALELHHLFARLHRAGNDGHLGGIETLNFAHLLQEGVELLAGVGVGTLDSLAHEAFDAVKY